MYSLTSLLAAKSEDILLKWRQDGWADRWYKEYGMEPIKRILKESPSDQELEELLEKKIDGIKYEHEKLAKFYNKDYWLYQIAAIRALREEAQRIFALFNKDNIK